MKSVDSNKPRQTGSVPQGIIAPTHRDLAVAIKSIVERGNLRTLDPSCAKDAKLISGFNHTKKADRFQLNVSADSARSAAIVNDRVIVKEIGLGGPTLPQFFDAGIAPRF